jgi:2,5-diketo-D-gluconate reductase B
MEYIEYQGERIPKIGLGTWDLRGSECVREVKLALVFGYRHIDTAEYYRNESEIGAAISESGIDRGQLFLTSKVWTNHLKYEDLIQACHQSIENLGVESIDLYLIHAPSSHVPIEESMQAMNTLVKSGKIRHVGVSNFTVEQLQAAMQCCDTPIFTNQIKYHPLHSQDEMLAFCQRERILVTAYSPFAKGRALRSEVLLEIAQNHGVSAAQVTLRWLVDQDLVITIPKASGKAHLKQNLDIFEFELTAEQKTRIDEMRQ